MWLENLKELKSASGLKSKQIAEITNLPERTVKRIFSGETDNPYMDTIHRIVTALGGSLDHIFADTKAVIGTEDLSSLQAEVNRLNAELAMAQAENMILKDKNVALTAENGLLLLKLQHKEEIIAIHNYYNKLKSGE